MIILNILGKLIHSCSSHHQPEKIAHPTQHHPTYPIASSNEHMGESVHNFTWGGSNALSAGNWGSLTYGEVVVWGDSGDGNVVELFQYSLLEYVGMFYNVPHVLSLKSLESLVEQLIPTNSIHCSTRISTLW